MTRHFQVRACGFHARALRFAVYQYLAVAAHSHATEGAAGLAAPRFAKNENAGCNECGRDSFAGICRDRLALEAKLMSSVATPHPGQLNAHARRASIYLGGAGATVFFSEDSGVLSQNGATALASPVIS